MGEIIVRLLMAAGGVLLLIWSYHHYVSPPAPIVYDPFSPPESMFMLLTVLGMGIGALLVGTAAYVRQLQRPNKDPQ